MSKAGAGCLAGMFVFALSVPGLGLLLVGITALIFTGKGIAENDTLLMIYIIGAMATSYLLPIAVSVHKKNALWLIGIPIVTSLIFAFPSSFIANAGCEAGKEQSIWAMRAVPVVWAGEMFIADDNEKLSCDTF